MYKMDKGWGKNIDVERFCFSFKFVVKFGEKGR